MFALAVGLAVLVGLVRRGDLRAFADVAFRRLPLILAAFALRGALLWSGHHGWEAIGPYAPLLHVTSYGLLLFALLGNLHLPGSVLLALGTTLNFLAIAANNGRMPVDVRSLVSTGQGAEITYLAGRGDYVHTLLQGGSHLPWLADRFSLSFARPVIFSLGDAAVFCGLFVLVQAIMLRGHARTRVPESAT